MADRLRRSTIKQRIAALVIGLALPMAVLLIAVVFHLAGTLRGNLHRDLLQTTRALAATMDARLMRFVAVTEVLAGSPLIDSPDRNAFAAEAAHAVSDGIGVRWSIGSADGVRDLDAVPVAGADIAAAHRQALSERKTAISNVERDAPTQTWMIVVTTPIAGSPGRTLGLSVPARVFQDVMLEQQLPHEWLGGVLDQSGHFIARTFDNDRYVGRPASEGWRGVRRSEGIAMIRTLEGEPVVNANALTRTGGWSVGIGVPQATLDAPLLRTISWATAIGLIVTLLSLALALMIARHISGPIRQLHRSASAMLGADRGNAPAADFSTAPPEVERVWRALRGAIDRRQRTEDDLDRSIQQLRAASEGARFGTHEFDPATREVVWSNELRRLIGATNEGEVVPLKKAISVIHPEDRAGAIATMKHAIATRQPTYELEFRIERADGVIRWMMDRGRIVRNADTGEVAKVYGVLIDITARKRAEQLTSERLAELESLYRTAPIGLAVLSAAGRFVRVNQSLAQMNGIPLADHLDRIAWEVLPNLRDQIEPSFERVMATGDTFSVEVSGETMKLPGAVRHWSYNWYPVTDADGKVVAAGVTIEEVSYRIEAEDRQKMLVAELSHRVKNTLAVVQSIAAQTARSSPEPRAFREAFSARLASLAGAHGLLTKTAWSGATLPDILDGVLEPFRSKAQQGAISASAPAVSIPSNATITLTLMLHELATNAVKYGALSTPAGHIEVTGSVDASVDPEQVTVTWVESGGPLVVEPGERGFGTKLLELSAVQLQGTTELDFARTGLRFRLVFPLRRGRKDAK